MRIFWELRHFFKANQKQYWIAVALLTIVALLLMIPPRLIGQIVDEIVNQQLDSSTLYFTGGCLFVLAIVIYIARVLWRIFLFGASHKLAAETRIKLYQHWLRLSPSYFQRNKLGDLMAHATNDVEALQMTAGEGILAAFDGLLTGLIVLTMMVLTISWELTIAAFIPWPIAAIFMYRFGRELHSGFAVAQDSFGQLTDIGQETVSGVRTIKSYGQEADIQSKYNAIARTSSDAYMKVAHTDAKYHPTIGITIGASFLMTLIYGGWMILQQRLTLGQLTSFTMYLGYMIWPMFAFGWMLNIAERGSAAFKRITRLLAEKPDIEDTGSIEQLDQYDLNVELSDFHYPSYSGADADQADRKEQTLGHSQVHLHSLPILKNIRFTLPQSGTLGITGPTGSGKTTLLRLLLREYETQGAQILWGGIEVQNLKLDTLRHHIAYVPQEPFLFSTTIRENLLLGHSAASEKDLQRVIEVAALQEDIEGFPKGLDTVVGERGVTLSGGQKQRVALARALLREAPILILDDALSAVDTGTETRILAHLKTASRRQTTIIVSHRLSALRHAEQILVLQEGQIREQGSHAELLARQDWYASIYALQQIETELDRGH
ncbi:multidrug ABC transporter ATP-binding protein [Hahella sp. CCB-MM4]|uniref:ABC transporter ATP-binding protein n=1 Tax=Hahella sp. (strain CCB-MM4) TaxID=1926491 RepID=UPI000B9A840F|nr:ABC transporter transmembrane domain-containing protein [Hahella sp. CCB-MM4]OZG72144.1 multidrug ABC transporter ATP-binding protein [Hahella sp. CCB-MM4]